MRFVHRTSVALLLTAAIAAPSAIHAQIEEGRVPLQTARTELARLRADYAEAFNKKDAAALAAMYAADAVTIQSNGTVLTGREAIKNAFMTDAPSWPHLVITSDSLRVYGNTAMDHGTLAYHPTAGGEELQRYLVVLRRGMQHWHLVRVIAVPIMK